MATENSTNAACPFCDKQIQALNATVAELERQIGSLSQRMKELESGEANVEALRSLTAQLCGTCQTLFMGISSRSDLPELQERIRRQIEDLRSEIEGPKAAA
jgi:phage shock protein A